MMRKLAILSILSTVLLFVLVQLSITFPILKEAFVFVVVFSLCVVGVTVLIGAFWFEFHQRGEE